VNLPLETLLLAGLIVSGAYVVFGLTGFGSTIIAVPLLALLVPIKFAVPLMMLLDLAATLIVGVKFRKDIRRDELGWLVVFMLFGMFIGLTLLIKLPEHALLLALGLFVLGYAAWGLLRKGPLPSIRRAWSGPFGVAGGALSALFGTGGVVFAIYLSGRLTDKDELRTANSMMIMASAVARIFLFGASGLLTQEGLLGAALMLVPAMLLGFFAGNRLHSSVPSAMVVKAMHAVLVVAGITLLLRSAS